MNQQNLLSVDAPVCVSAQLLEQQRAGGLLPPPGDVVRSTSQERVQTGSSDGFITGFITGERAQHVNDCRGRKTRVRTFQHYF